MGTSTKIASKPETANIYVDAAELAIALDMVEPGEPPVGFDIGFFPDDYQRKATVPVRIAAAIAELRRTPRGSMDRTGVVTLRWDIQHARLDAPPVNGEPRQWLPCHECGAVQSVPINTVSVCCEACIAKAGGAP